MNAQRRETSAHLSWEQPLGGQERFSQKWGGGGETVCHRLFLKSSMETGVSPLYQASFPGVTRFEPQWNRGSILQLKLMASFPAFVNFQSGLESSDYLVHVKARQKAGWFLFPVAFSPTGPIGCIRGLRCEALGASGALCDRLPKPSPQDWILWPSRLTRSWHMELAFLTTQKAFPTTQAPEAAPEWILSATLVENSNGGFSHTANVQGFSPWWIPLVDSLYGRSLSPEWPCGCHGLMSTQANRILRLPGKVSLTPMPFHFRICSLANGLDQGLSTCGS